MGDMDHRTVLAKSLAEMSGWLRASTDWMRPGRSLISNVPVSHGASFTGHEFANVDRLQPPFCDVCAFPFEYDEGQGVICAGCLAEPPQFKRARAPFVYSDLISDMVLSLKRQGRRSGLNFFANQMWVSGKTLIEEADYLVPVPLHYRRLASRGFNQAGWLAEAVSKVSGCPVRHDLIRRVKASQSQGHLSPQQRRANVAGAFSVPSNKTVQVHGRRIVLVDDVYTTGATVNACVRALKKAKAANVDVLTLARVVSPRKASI